MKKNISLEKRIKQLQSLNPYKDKSYEYIKKQAEISLKKQELKIEDHFENPEDGKAAKELFDRYLGNYTFDSMSDLNSLADLVFEEISKTKYKKILSALKVIPNKDATKQLHDIENQVLNLKIALGIDKADKKEDDLTAFQTANERLTEYIKYNEHEFTIASGCCGKMLVLRRQVKDFKALIHPHFSGRFWYNAKAMKLVKRGRLTKEEYAEIFATSVQYVDWCLENENKILEAGE